MQDKIFYSAAAVLAVLLIAFSFVWPQGTGMISPAPFGHKIELPDYFRMVRERDARHVREAARKAEDAANSASASAAVSSASSAISSSRAAKH